MVPHAKVSQVENFPEYNATFVIDNSECDFSKYSNCNRLDLSDNSEHKHPYESAIIRVGPIGKSASLLLSLAD